MLPDPPNHQGSSVSARLRIVGWIVLTTAVALLAVTATMRSIMLAQIADSANIGIAQEIEEFRTFAAEAVDPTTAKPFSSMHSLMERYLARQQPMAGEAILAKAGGKVLTIQNTADQMGQVLAEDPVLLGRILANEKTSGVAQSSHGTVRWAKAVAQNANGQRGPEHQAQLVVAHYTAGAQEKVDQQAVLLFGIAAGGLALTAGIAWLVSRQIMRPIHTMGVTAAQISANDLSARVPVLGRDDLARLAQTFNAMLDRVEAAHLAQRHFIAEAREHLNEPQRELALALSELNRQGLSAQRRQLVIAKAQELIEKMGQTLLDLEILAQSSNPDFVQPSYVAVGEVTADVAAAAARPGAYLDRRFRIQESARAQAWLDPIRVSEAMHQLIHNAVTHTQAAECIRIGSTIDGDHVSFWVANDGPALDPDQARAMFETYRSAFAHDERASGMGLGLAVVKAVAQAHGGTAWVESGDGVGTRFGFSLPIQGQGTAARGEAQFAQHMTGTLGSES
ncbi:ATP-binding protein [Glutamicibacter sp. TV12E]|uniref:ATP-binding protein n=1 Tax=Glutamicibacter sp. TV12E TaxID=3446362 RepID=UPI0040343099